MSELDNSKMHLNICIINLVIIAYIKLLKIVFCILFELRNYKHTFLISVEILNTHILNKYR